MKAIHQETDLFPAFARAEAQEGERRRAVERERRLREHRESMKCCWPEWDGPVANGHGTSAFCEVGDLLAYSLTHGQRRYHYTAPCRIESVSADGLTIIGVVEYSASSPCSHHNGERLRLDITEVWPPVFLLSEQRRKQRPSPRALPHRPAHPQRRTIP